MEPRTHANVRAGGEALARIDGVDGGDGRAEKPDALRMGRAGDFDSVGHEVEMAVHVDEAHHAAHVFTSAARRARPEGILHACDSAQDKAGEHLPHDGWQVGGRTERRSAAVALGACRELGRDDGCFGGVQHVEVTDAALAAALADDAREGIAARLVDVCEAEPLGVEFHCASHAAHDGDFRTFGISGKLEFR